MQYVADNGPSTAWIGVSSHEPILVVLDSRVTDCLISVTARLAVSNVALSSLRS